MSYALSSVCHFALPVIPQTTASVEHRMMALAEPLQSIVDLNPHRTGLVPPNVYWMPARYLLVTGTRCPRPALLNEAADTAANVGLDMIIVRDEIGHPSGLRTSFDIRLDAEKRWRCGYYLWQAEDGRYWLLPDEDRPGGLRISPLGFVVVTRPPYVDQADLSAGLKRANANLDRFAWGR